MFRAFGRLALIGAGTLLLIFFALFGLRSLGSLQSFTTFDHPIMNQKVIRVADLSLAKTTIVDDQIYQVELTTNKDLLWVGPSGLAAVEIFKQFNDRNLLINVNSRRKEVLSDLSDSMKKHLDPLKVLVRSPFAFVPRELRKIEARWIFAGSPADLAQNKTMASLFIETVASFKADVYILPKKWTRHNPTYERMVKEMKRRHKKVLIVTDDDPASIVTSDVPSLENSWLKPYTDGFVPEKSQF